MNSYGAALILCHNGNSTSLKGFLQPGKSLSQRSAEWKVSPLGEIPADQYLYIGPVMSGAEAGDTLMLDGKQYELRQVETVMYQSTPIYLWGLCVQKGGTDTWGS